MRQTGVPIPETAPPGLSLRRVSGLRRQRYFNSDNSCHNLALARAPR